MATVLSTWNWTPEFQPQPQPQAQSQSQSQSQSAADLDPGTSKAVSGVETGAEARGAASEGQSQSQSQPQLQSQPQPPSHSQAQNSESSTTGANAITTPDPNPDPNLYPTETPTQDPALSQFRNPQLRERAESLMARAADIRGDGSGGGRVQRDANPRQTHRSRLGGAGRGGVINDIFERILNDRSNPVNPFNLFDLNNPFNPFNPFNVASESAVGASASARDGERAIKPTSRASADADDPFVRMFSNPLNPFNSSRHDSARDKIPTSSASTRTPVPTNGGVDSKAVEQDGVDAETAALIEQLTDEYHQDEYISELDRDQFELGATHSKEEIANGRNKGKGLGKRRDTGGSGSIHKTWNVADRCDETLGEFLIDDEAPPIRTSASASESPHVLHSAKNPFFADGPDEEKSTTIPPVPSLQITNENPLPPPEKTQLQKDEEYALQLQAQQFEEWAGVEEDERVAIELSRLGLEVEAPAERPDEGGLGEDGGRKRSQKQVQIPISDSDIITEPTRTLTGTSAASPSGMDYLEAVRIIEQAALDDRAAALAFSQEEMIPEQTESQRMVGDRGWAGWAALEEGPGDFAGGSQSGGGRSGMVRETSRTGKEKKASGFLGQGRHRDVVYDISDSEDDDEDDQYAIARVAQLSRAFHASSTSVAGPSSSSRPDVQVECISCLERVGSSSALHVSCGDKYCPNCVVTLVEKFTKDESFYPLHCCNNTPIAVDAVNPFLSPDLQLLLEAKNREYGVPAHERLYCCSPTCSEYLGARYSHGRNVNAVVCPKEDCRTSTCPRCRRLAHPREDCSVDREAIQVRSLARQQGWQTCPGCRTIVELDVGCYHMTCRCQTEFCYLCAAPWKQCACPQWDEDRLLVQAERRVRNEFGERYGTMETRVVREHVLRRVEIFRQDHECQHRFKYQEVAGQCEQCRHNMPNFTYICQECSMLICGYCKRNGRV